MIGLDEQPAPCVKVDPRQELEKGITITDAIIDKIKELILEIACTQDNQEIQWLSKLNNKVFKLLMGPNLVFKMTDDGNILRKGKWIGGAHAKIELRFANMIKGMEVCLENHLDLLKIPHAKKLEIEVTNSKIPNLNGKYKFIVEESLNFDSNQDTQDKLFQYSKPLDATVKQLVIFIAKTGFSDVARRNIPILNNESGYQGPPHVGLIDIEEMENSVNGLIGERCGLIGCVPEEQIDMVIKEARRQGVNLSEGDALQAKETRLQMLTTEKAQRLFYEQKGIVIGNEPIQVKEHDLDFSSQELKEFALEVIKEINSQLEQSSPKDSLKSRRQITIKTDNASRFYRKDATLVDEKVQWTTQTERRNATYLGCVMTKLEELGIVYQLIARYDCVSYVIQC